MKLAMITLVTAVTMAFATATAQAAPQSQSLDNSYDRLAPRSASVSDRATTNNTIEQVAYRRGGRYYRSYPGRYYQPRYRSYRGYPSYRYYNSYPRYYNGYRGRYYNNYRGGFGVYGRNFSFGIGF